jgi:hypothetical protein
MIHNKFLIITVQASRAVAMLLQGQTRTSAVRTLTHAAVGTAAQFYDTVTFGLLAYQIGAALLPAGLAPATRLTLVFVAFAAGRETATNSRGVSTGWQLETLLLPSSHLEILTHVQTGHVPRPVGTLIWPAVARRYSPRAVIGWTAALTALPAAFIGAVPAFHQAGYAGAAAALAMRLLQGLALGSDVAGPVAALSQANFSSPALAASLVPAAAALGALIAAVVCTIIAAALTPEALGVWGWRVPLVGSLVVGVATAAARLWVLREPQQQLVQQQPRVVTARGFAAEAEEERPGDAAVTTSRCAL